MYEICLPLSHPCTFVNNLEKFHQSHRNNFEDGKNFEVHQFMLPSHAQNILKNK